MKEQDRSPLLQYTIAVVAFTSMLLFSLQPLTIDQMQGWHSPVTVVQFFQWTYLLGVLISASTVKLSPRADVAFAAALFVPVAIYTLVLAMPGGPRRLGHLAPIAVWLASVPTVMIRSIAGTINADKLRPYSLIAASNVGALISVLLWMQPFRLRPETVWLAAASSLFLIGLSLAMLTSVSHKLPAVRLSTPAAICQRPTYREPLWFLLAFSTSLALVFTYHSFFNDMETQLSMASFPQANTSMPLLVFLLAYVVGWLPGSGHTGKGLFPMANHSLVVILLRRWLSH